MPRLLRFLTISGKDVLPASGTFRSITPELIVADSFLAHYGISRPQLVDLAFANLHPTWRDAEATLPNSNSFLGGVSWRRLRPGPGLYGFRATGATPAAAMRGTTVTGRVPRVGVGIGKRLAITRDGTIPGGGGRFYMSQLQRHRRF